MPSLTYWRPTQGRNFTRYRVKGQATQGMIILYGFVLSIIYTNVKIDELVEFC